MGNRHSTRSSTQHRELIEAEPVAGTSTTRSAGSPAGERRRAGPVAAQLKLVTIRFSHYNVARVAAFCMISAGVTHYRCVMIVVFSQEKARWALDRYSVPYDEKPYMPLLHMLPVMWATAFGRRGKGPQSDGVSSRFSTPCLVVTERHHQQTPELVLQDSSLIARWASDQFATSAADSLYPPEHEAQIQELEKLFHDRLGPYTRRLAYFYVLQKRQLVADTARACVGRVQYWTARLLMPLLVGGIRRGLMVNEQSAARALDRCREVFGQVSEMLSDGRRYLVGDQFAAADLSFACMAAPLLYPSPEEGYGAYFPPLAEVGPEFAALVEEFRATPAGQYGLRMFREERGTRAKPCYPLIPQGAKM